MATSSPHFLPNGVRLEIEGELWQRRHAAVERSAARVAGSRGPVARVGGLDPAPDAPSIA